MDNNEKQMKQSDVLRDKVRTFGVISVFIDIIIVVCNAYVLSGVEMSSSTKGSIILAFFLMTGFEIFSVNMFISAKRESYRTQADMLDVLTDIRDGKKKQEETKAE